MHFEMAIWFIGNFFLFVNNCFVVVGQFPGYIFKARVSHKTYSLNYLFLTITMLKDIYKMKIKMLLFITLLL